MQLSGVRQSVCLSVRLSHTAAAHPGAARRCCCVPGGQEHRANAVLISWAG